VGVAAIRAVHLPRDGEPKVMRDDYALALTGWSEEQAFAMAETAKVRGAAARQVKQAERTVAK
jgi:hypothetical protein